MKNRRRSNVYGYNRPNPDKRGGALRVEITPNSYQAYEGYFLCENDSIATTSDAKDMQSTRLSKTVTGVTSLLEHSSKKVLQMRHPSYEVDLSINLL